MSMPSSPSNDEFPVVIACTCIYFSIYLSTGWLQTATKGLFAFSISQFIFIVQVELFLNVDQVISFSFVYSSSIATHLYLWKPCPCFITSASYSMLEPQKLFSVLSGTLLCLISRSFTHAPPLHLVCLANPHSLWSSLDLFLWKVLIRCSSLCKKHILCFPITLCAYFHFNVYHTILLLCFSLLCQAVSYMRAGIMSFFHIVISLASRNYTPHFWYNTNLLNDSINNHVLCQDSLL